MIDDDARASSPDFPVVIRRIFHRVVLLMNPTVTGIKRAVATAAFLT
jgi:hypothetical protein